MKINNGGIPCQDMVSMNQLRAKKQERHFGYFDRLGQTTFSTFSPTFIALSVARSQKKMSTSSIRDLEKNNLPAMS